MFDGLVTNVSIILGFAGAHPAGSVVRLAGLAGLVAGAFSMGAGEFVSMTTQRELIERELDIERRALRDTPEIETQELIEIFVDKGIAPELAQKLAVEVMSDPQLALETHAREEFGVDPNVLGSPVTSALASFLAVSLGSFIPLLPWLIGSGDGAIVWSVVLSACAAFTLGGLLGALTARPWWRAAVRSLSFASIAAAVTYAIGRAVGTG
jgi:VIT1/CCC1 family predicted Fe2+/Mn2+ transporter